METKTSKAKIKGNHMLWVIRWIRLGSAQNSKHASAQLSAIWREERGGLTESLGPSCVSCWFHYGVTSLLLQRPQVCYQWRAMIMKTYCSEMSQSVLLKLHYLCVCVSACQCTDVCQEVRAAGCDVWQVVLWLTRPLCCSVTCLSSLTCSSGSSAHMPPDPPAHHGWLGRYSCIRWAQAICLDTPAFWFRRHLLCASLTGGVATVSAPADRPDRQQHNEWLMMQTVLSFCTVNTT